MKLCRQKQLIQQLPVFDLMVCCWLPVKLITSEQLKGNLGVSTSHKQHSPLRTLHFTHTTHALIVHRTPGVHSFSLRWLLLIPMFVCSKVNSKPLEKFRFWYSLHSCHVLSFRQYDYTLRRKKFMVL